MMIEFAEVVAVLQNVGQRPVGQRDPADDFAVRQTALARYNGSIGRNTYPALVMQRWQRVWRF